MRIARKTGVGTTDRAIDDRTGGNLENPGDQLITKGGDARRARHDITQDVLGGGCEPDERRDIERPGADLALLATAVGQRGEFEPPTRHQRADPQGAALSVMQYRMG